MEYQYFRPIQTVLYSMDSTFWPNGKVLWIERMHNITHYGIVHWHISKKMASTSIVNSQHRATISNFLLRNECSCILFRFPRKKENNDIYLHTISNVFIFSIKLLITLLKIHLLTMQVQQINDEIECTINDAAVAVYNIEKENNPIFIATWNIESEREKWREEEPKERKSHKIAFSFIYAVKRKTMYLHMFFVPPPLCFCLSRPYLKIVCFLRMCDSNPLFVVYQTYALCTHCIYLYAHGCEEKWKYLKNIFFNKQQQQELAENRVQNAQKHTVCQNGNFMRLKWLYLEN